MLRNTYILICTKSTYRVQEFSRVQSVKLKWCEEQGKLPDIKTMITKTDFSNTNERDQIIFFKSVMQYLGKDTIEYTDQIFGAIDLKKTDSFNVLKVLSLWNKCLSDIGSLDVDKFIRYINAASDHISSEDMIQLKLKWCKLKRCKLPDIKTMITKTDFSHINEKDRIIFFKSVMQYLGKDTIEYTDQILAIYSIIAKRLNQLENEGHRRGTRMGIPVDKGAAENLNLQDDSGIDVRELIL